MKKRNLIIILMAMSLVLILFVGGCKKTGKAASGEEVICATDMPYCPVDCQKKQDVDCTGQAQRVPPDCEPDCDNQEHPRVDPVPWRDPPKNIYDGPVLCPMVMKRCDDGSYVWLCGPPNRNCDNWCPCPGRGQPQPPPPRKYPYPWPYKEIYAVWMNYRPADLNLVSGAVTHGNEEESPKGEYQCVVPDATPSPEKYRKYNGELPCTEVQASPSPTPTPTSTETP